MLRHQIDVCNTTSINRCLHRYGCQQTPVVLQHHGHLHHHGSNGSMSVALRLKFQLDIHRNLTWEKMTNTRNTSASSFDMKFICYHPFPVVADKRETKYENESTAFDRQREIDHHEKRERANTNLDIIFCIFYCSSLFTSPQQVWEHFTELTPKWVLSFLAHLHIIASSS